MPDLPMRPLDDSDIPEVEVPKSEQPTPPRDPEAWAPIKQALEEFFEDEEFRFHIWIEPIELVVLRQHELVIAVPPTFRRTVEARYSRAIARIAEEVLGEQMTVKVVSTEWFPAE